MPALKPMGGPGERCRGLPFREDWTVALEGQAVCQHCRIPMVRWANPEGTTWSGEYQFVCFNDQCPYFVRGWIWMQEHYNVTASYRHRLDPETGETGPLPVWSREALREGIIREKDESDA